MLYKELEASFQQASGLAINHGYKQQIRKKRAIKNHVSMQIDTNDF